MGFSMQDHQPCNMSDAVCVQCLKHVVGAILSYTSNVRSCQHLLRYSYVSSTCHTLQCHLTSGHCLHGLRKHQGRLNKMLCTQNGNGGDDDGPPEDGQTDAEEFSSFAEENVVTTAPREVYIVDSVPKAQVALQRLQAIHAANPDTIFACDTEVPHRCFMSRPNSKVKTS